MLSLADLGSVVFGSLYEQRVGATILAIALTIGILLVAMRRGWILAARRHPRRTAVLAAPALAVALPIVWYLVSPVFLSTSIDEAPPVVVAAKASGRPSAQSSAAAVASHARAQASASLPAAPPPPATATPARLAELSGSFQGSDDFHFGRGTARLIETGRGSWVVRLEDFAVRNGPDLHVYLSRSPDGSVDGAVDLGRLKADRGNQNYAVPQGALNGAPSMGSVVIWCKQFSHLFATAPLHPS